MQPRAFLYNVANAYRIDAKTLAIFAREMRAAGFLTTGARGVNAPHMTPVDAARITIALLSTDKPARAVKRVERFGNLPFDPSKSKGAFPDALKIEDGTALESVLTNLFAADLEADYPFANAPYVEVHENARRAVLEFTSDGEKSCAAFEDTRRTDAERAEDARELFGIRQSRGLASAELTQLYLPFYLERRDGITWEERYRGADSNGYPLDPAHPWNADLPPKEREARIAEIQRYIEERASN